mmetsp:Transcript_6027/g.16393  ORF Transcript_6027/g.16393 Transcript_6027/m.16393 type:complete len:444 (-) Transcript_6027:226-1557(-)|eukprot:CAMPEP_0198120866 /NCGR_PEP_ID=MMETSP1442-20131203/30556_1 /TAXON_ID= /ORGANISM="Craspedostauros australis, Strain CCMP3328" /LENGTH=443 /DNA_ID=CAMNT_0043779597 /DNA_START=63 /DNA_END=1394 /DNA_ORIENTATION=+
MSQIQAPIPDEALLLFFRCATTMLKELDCAVQCEDGLMSIADCRQRLLDRQLSTLSRAVYDYNEANSMQMDQAKVQQRLASLRGDDSVSRQVLTAMEEMDEAARLALVRLVLYIESNHDQQDQQQQKERGTSQSGVEAPKPNAQRSLKPKRHLEAQEHIQRSKLIEFIALNQAAINLPETLQFLNSGKWIFEDIQLKEEWTAQKMPQNRLERIQCMVARAVGYEPTHVTAELMRIFFDKKTSGNNEFSSDEQVKSMFAELIAQMNAVVASASLYITNNRLSDVSDGGVTRVVSVNFSEVGGNSGGNGDGPTSAAGASGAAPTTKRMTDAGIQSAASSSPSLASPQQQQALDDASRKQQIRLASEAVTLQKSIIDELTSMPAQERNRKLEEARKASQVFMTNAMKFAPGPERIAYMRQIDAKTQRLLAMDKIWKVHVASGTNTI